MADPQKQLFRAPADQPGSVREITQRLFPAYTVDGGSIHLAGCRLEDRLFLRIDDSGHAPGRSLYVDFSGRPIEREFARSLGMEQTVAWEPPPEMPPGRLEQMVRQGAESARRRWGVEGQLEAEFIWCKHAEGKLRFTIGDQSVDLPFSDWARTLDAPPFVCPHSQAKSFHVAATDDGRIAAAESIATCEETGRRVLANELVRCDATGMSVFSELARRCPVSECFVLKRHLVACASCCQRVSPAVIQRGRCSACRTASPLATDQPPLADLLARHPSLNRWPKWTASETADVHILIAAGWWKRLVVVVDRADQSIRCATLGTRLGGKFSPIQVGQIDSRA